MFLRVGRLVTRHPWWVIGVWVVLAIVIVAVAPSLSSVSNADQTSFLPDKYDSALAQKVAERAFPQNANASSVFVIKRSDRGKLTAANQKDIVALADKLNGAKIEHVAAVVTSKAMIAPNGTAQLVTVVFNGLQGDQKLQDAVPSLREMASGLLRGSGLQAGLTGAVAMAYDTVDSFKSAQNIVAIATIVLIIVLLGLIFRSPIASLLPVAAIGLVYVLSTSVVALLAKALSFQIDQSVTALLIVVLFGIGTDYVLFLLFRFRERLRAGDEPHGAIVTSVARVGRAIASSGLVVMAAMAALFLSDLKSFRSMAPVFMVAVALMLLASLTLIPALLALIRGKVFWPSRSWQTAPKGRFWKGLAGQIARHPGRMAAASGGLLVVLACGMLFMHINYDVSGSLPSSTKSAQATKALESSFPAGALSPTQVYVTSTKTLGKAQLAGISERLARIQGVATVTAPILNEKGTAAGITISLKDPPFSSVALDVANRIRDTAHAMAGPGEQLVVGGQTMAFAELRAATTRDYSVVFPVAAIAILVILVLLLRSVIAPLYLLAGVWLGFAATLGASAMVFQGIGGDPGLMFMMPMICYLFVVAVGTDYNILLTTRLREEIVEGATPHDAAAMAVQHGGATVAAAGVILAGTFGSLMLVGIGLLSEMGFAVAVGILLVAIVMASILMPSIATLLGRRVWWPGHQAERTRTADDAAPNQLGDQPAASRSTPGALEPRVGQSRPAEDSLL
jgi:RND superfamily putative drug exporter